MRHLLNLGLEFVPPHIPQNVATTGFLFLTFSQILTLLWGSKIRPPYLKNDLDMILSSFDVHRKVDFVLYFCNEIDTF